MDLCSACSMKGWRLEYLFLQHAEHAGFEAHGGQAGCRLVREIPVPLKDPDLCARISANSVCRQGRAGLAKRSAQEKGKGYDDVYGCDLSDKRFLFWKNVGLRVFLRR